MAPQPGPNSYRHRRQVSLTTRTTAHVEKKLLFYGDNLPILREHVKDESVDLGVVTRSRRG